MIGVLIVDDEVLCAEGVKCSTDWNALEVDQVYTAYSMKQAMKVLEEHEVDIILTDVEMPKGTGLDLLEWVREGGDESCEHFAYQLCTVQLCETGY